MTNGAIISFKKMEKPDALGSLWVTLTEGYGRVLVTVGVYNPVYVRDENDDIHKSLRKTFNGSREYVKQPIPTPNHFGRLVTTFNGKLTNSRCSLPGAIY